MLQGQRFDSVWLQGIVNEYWEQQRRILEVQKQQEITEANRETLNEIYRSLFDGDSWRQSSDKSKYEIRLGIGQSYSCIVESV